MKRQFPGLVVAALALIVIVDFPRDFQWHSHWDKVALIPFVSPPIRPVDIVGNFLLGVPAGLAAGVAFARGVLAAGLLTLAASLIGEFTQVYGHGRFPSATDVVCNVGGAIFTAVASTAGGRRQPGEHE